MNLYSVFIMIPFRYDNLKVPFNKKNATFSENKVNSWKVFRSMISYYM